MKKNKIRKSKKTNREELYYDDTDMSDVIGAQKSLQFKDLGLRLPETPPTQVISIRVPTQLLNEIRAISSQVDVPYQGLIKMYLSEAVSKAKVKKRVGQRGPVNRLILRHHLKIIRQTVDQGRVV